MSVGQGKVEHISPNGRGYQYDVIIVGGGPVGSTAGTLLKKYEPSLSVLILEKEKFPRDHIGESQLPTISAILHEMGVWDAVEAAGFPIKIGASYTWGANHDQWDFDFYPVELFKDQPRPGKYEDQRVYTAFQVDRSKYDHILLRHAEAIGAEVQENAKVEEILTEGDRITGVRMADGRVLTGRYYIDGSGMAALFRRSLGIATEVPPQLKNIAIWDYWENAEWAVRIGSGATRIQVRSLPWGWIWFIPLGPTRTSIGLVCPAEYYKSTGKSPAALYEVAIQSQPQITKLIAKGMPRGRIETCKDWSHLAERIVGENWFICGEAAGFADPILSAGMTLAHNSAREAAYSILELSRGQLDGDWIRRQYNSRNRNAIRQHIRFALYWYSANSCFTDLKEHCRKIARQAGLRLSPQQAWRWLSVGGFSNDATGRAIAGSFDVASAKQILELFDGHGKCKWLCNGYNVFKLKLGGAETGHIGEFIDGRIHLADCYIKGDRVLPRSRYYGKMIDILQVTSDGVKMAKMIEARVKGLSPAQQRHVTSRFIQALEVMIQEGWVERKLNKKRSIIEVGNEGQRYIRYTTETEKAIENAGRPASYYQKNF
jgi:flavin-dependent dehydrogenase